MKSLSGYIDFGRNDPCPCGSGKKFKKCCRETVEKMMFHWNNRSRWPWMTPQLQKALSLVCGLPPGEGEGPAPVSAIEKALDKFTKTVFEKENEKEFFEAMASKWETFAGMLEEEECFKDLRFSDHVVDSFLDNLEEKLGDTEERPSEEELQELIDEEIDRVLPRLVGRRETENLAWKLINTLRRETFGPEKQQAVISALLTCLEGGANPVWEMIFRISLSEAGFEDKEDPGGAERTWPDPSWPVVRSFVPRRDVWNVCGFGSAGVVQEQPGGLLSLTFFQLGLIDGGLLLAFNKGDLTPDRLETLLKDLGHHAPPWREGPPELASRYAWGAYAMKLEEGVSWSGDVERYLAVLPQPRGGPKQWLEGLLGAGGLTPPGLVEVVRRNKTPDDIPDGKELMVITAMRYSVRQPEELIGSLRRESPEFIPDGEEEGKFFFSWTREYPEGHTSPAAQMGGRQVLGNITIEKNAMLAETGTLSWAGRLMTRLCELAGDNITFEDVRWTAGQDLLKSCREE
ncbi:MAG: SEC-C metal-binding domain-containing protein [Bacillota bacterium]